MKKRSYPKPPILEALCEFQFVSSKPWDLTIPGLMYEKVKDRFPEKRNLRTINVEVRISSEAVEQKVEPTLPRTQFLSRDANKVLQVAPDLLVVNWLRPYSSWEEFKPVILDAFRKYDAVASPEGFKRIGLRYINKIDFPSARIELQEYLTFYPETPSELADPIGSFFRGLKSPIPSQGTFSYSRSAARQLSSQTRPQPSSVLTTYLPSRMASIKPSWKAGWRRRIRLSKRRLRLVLRKNRRLCSEVEQRELFRESDAA